MLKRYEIVEGKVGPCESEQAPLLVYVNPDESERKLLIEQYRIDEHTLLSALDPDEVSRLEYEPDHIAIIYKRPKNYSAEDNFLFKVVSAGMFLFKDRLILVMSENVPLFEGRMFAKAQSPVDIMLKLFSRSIFHFLEHLRVITLVTDSLEQKLNSSMENKYLLNLFTLEKSLVYYLNAITANSSLLEKLRKDAAKVGLSPDNVEFLEDVAIENQQCLRQAEVYSGILAGLMDARASIVSNNLNQLMKTLNIITIGIMVPTFVVSAFSMNVSIPLQQYSYAFWIIMGLALVSVVGFMGYWRYKKW